MATSSKAVNSSSESPQKKDFTVGWICALPVELAPARAMLDEEFEMIEDQHPADGNSYQLGRIGKHKIAIACLPEYGTNPAATVAQNMLRTFDSIKVGLMVGIGAGVPTASDDIRLGDVVVSSPDTIHPGVVQWDRGKSTCGEFERTGSLNKAPTVLQTALANLKADHLLNEDHMSQNMEAALSRHPRLRKNKYFYQGFENDVLYNVECLEHSEPEDQCQNCKLSLTPIKREPRDDMDPMIHYGTIASGNQVVKDGHERDRLGHDLGAKCIEMEAAGLMNNFPCLVIRGICDYADSRKNKCWQPYAAMTAAAYAKELLSFVNPQRLEQIPDVVKVVTSSQIHKDVSDLNNAEKLKKVEDWLSPPDSSENLRAAKVKRHQGTGFWFLQSEPFARWMAGGTRLLWLHGFPGCGKTILSSTIIQMLCDSQHTVIYHYFDFSDANKQTVNKMLCSLMHQLYRQHESSRQPLDKLMGATSTATNQTLVETLTQMLRLAKGTRIVLDALDECVERIELLQHIKAILDGGSHDSQLIITSRREEDLESSITRWIEEDEQVSLQNKAVNGGIGAYVRGSIRRDERFERWHKQPDVLSEIELKIAEKAEGMFRWAACQLDALSECLTNKMLTKALNTLPKDLSSTYSRILQNIPSAYREEAIKILQLLTFAELPLTVEAAVDALATDHDENPPFDPKNRMPRPTEILRLCSSLVTLKLPADNSEDTEIQLAHFSVKEYLLSDHVEEGYKACLSELYARASLLKIFFAYLSTTPLNDGSYLSSLGEDFPLAKTAFESWPTHARKTEKTDDLVRTYIQDLFVTAGYTFRVLFRYNLMRGLDGFVESGQMLLSTRLFFAAVVGLECAVGALLAYGADVNAMVPIDNDDKMTALHVASGQGYEGVVALLLDAGADVNLQTRNDFGPTALDAAIKAGHRSIAKQLIDKGAEVNFVSKTGSNVLKMAMESRNEDMVKFILDHGADPNSGSENFPSALVIATMWKQNDLIVQMLLDYGANVNARSGRSDYHDADSFYGDHWDISLHFGLAGHAAYQSTGVERSDTVLQVAAAAGHEDIVQLLLENGADVNARGGPSNTALQAAAVKGLEDTVRLLLEHGADPHITAEQGIGESVLQLVARRDNKEIVQMLIEHGADVDIRDQMSVTPLQAAALLGRHKVVQLLLDNGALINDQGGEYGCALYAAYSGRDFLEKFKKIHATASRPFDISGERKKFRRTIEVLLANGACAPEIRPNPVYWKRRYWILMNEEDKFSNPDRRLCRSPSDDRSARDKWLNIDPEDEIGLQDLLSARYEHVWEMFDEIGRRF